MAPLLLRPKEHTSSLHDGHGAGGRSCNAIIESLKGGQLSLLVAHNVEPISDHMSIVC